MSLLHEKENSPELQSFLEENSVKFNGHCLLALRLMYSGVRLTDNKAVADYGFSGRRLRELHAEFPNKVKKIWVTDSKGKRLYVEYFIEQPISPTKAKEIAWAEQYLEKQNQLKQAELFNS